MRESRVASRLSAPRCVGRGAVARRHSRPGRRSRLCGAERFFYCRPLLLQPKLHLFLVALASSLGGTLQTPVHGSQNLPNMTGVIVHPSQALDNLGHARQRPQIRVKTVRPRALSERLVHLPQMGRLQLRLAARAPRPAEQRLRRVATLYTNVSHSADSLSVRERWMRGSAYRLQTGGPPVGGDAQGLENPGVEVQAYRQYR